LGWHKITLTRDQIAHLEGNRLMQHFGDLNLNAGGPNDSALFSALMPGSQWNVAYYFSPKASVIGAALIQKYRGFTCEAPDRDSVSLVHGRDPVAWELLGPSRKS
jgi:hypothetical protein